MTDDPWAEIRAVAGPERPTLIAVAEVSIYRTPWPALPGRVQHVIPLGPNLTAEQLGTLVASSIYQGDEPPPEVWTERQGNRLLVRREQWNDSAGRMMVFPAVISFTSLELQAAMRSVRRDLRASRSTCRSGPPRSAPTSGGCGRSTGSATSTCSREPSVMRRLVPPALRSHIMTH